MVNLLPRSTVWIAAGVIASFLPRGTMGARADDHGQRHLSPAPGGAARPAVRELERAYALRETADDSWESERLNEQIGHQLDWIGRVIAGGDSTSHDDLHRPLDADFGCSPLRPLKLAIVFDDESFIVRRHAAAKQDTDEPISAGWDGLWQAVRDATSPFEATSPRHVKFKVFEIGWEGDELRTRAYCWVTGSSPAGRVQQRSTWNCTWRVDDSGGRPRLRRIMVEDFTEATYRTAGGSLMRDATAAVLQNQPAMEDQLRFGVDHWAARLDRRLGVGFYGHHGLAVGDVNGDDLEDVYVCQPGGLPNRLFLQRPDGTAYDASESFGVDFLDSTQSALMVDLDNDGDEDLMLGTGSGVFVFDNDRRIRFRPAWSMAATSVFSLAAADYDGDGLLDLYACRYSIPDRSDAAPMPYHDANNGPPNVLLKNTGNWTFQDVTVESGLDVNNRRFSFAAAWDDFDLDGDPDLFVANDFGRKNLYRNDGGHFLDVTADAGVEDIGAGMSAAWGDIDNDGRADLYVGNMFSSAGGRITRQRQFLPDMDAGVRGLYQRHARGNSLFRNMGDGRFLDVSETAGVTMGRWAWGSVLFDINNDGWQDIFITNGFITNTDTRDL